jgi:hypothetical protein
MELLIYNDTTTSRLEYIVSTLLPAIGITRFIITSDIDFFTVSDKAKINYSYDHLAESEVWIKPVKLLFESDIRQQQVECFKWKEFIAFFRTEGDLPFDIFAASFYLLTRYEEYLPHSLDMYGRYGHKNSLAFQQQFLDLPLINLWLRHLQKELQRRFSTLTFTPPAFEFLPTYDIDIAWSYKEKGVIRNAGGLVKSIIKGSLGDAAERIAVLQDKKKDPFDSYDWLDQLHTKYNFSPIYFFLVAERNKGYDKNIPPKRAAFKELVKEHALKYGVGIHPSWQSGDEHKLMMEEILILENLAGKKVTKSRQHYIRMKLPETYRALIATGITEDYSMGYGSINGFRASYCLPFKWYDLQKEETTSLNIYPFCYMEANSYFEQHYSPEQALAEMEHYYAIVKQLEGLLITIWHNHFLGTDRMFTGWREIYRTMIAKIARR